MDKRHPEYSPVRHREYLSERIRRRKEKYDTLRPAPFDESRHLDQGPLMHVHVKRRSQKIKRLTNEALGTRHNSTKGHKFQAIPVKPLQGGRSRSHAAMNIDD